MRLAETVSWGAFLLAGVAEAMPANKKGDECTTQATCKKIKNLLGSKAAPACSAYLGPRTKTVTITQTTVQTARQTTQLPQLTESATVDRTTTLFQTSEETRYSDNPTATVYGTVTTGVASTTTIYRYAGPQKRYAAATVDPLLRDMEKRHPKSFVSEACSCVYKPTTKTVTRTAQVTKSTTQVTTKPAPPPVTLTATRDVSVTQQVDLTTTVGPTSTVTSEIVTSVAPPNAVLVVPAACNVRGLPGPGGFNYSANFNSNQAACISSCKTDARCYATGFYQVTNPSTGTVTGTCRFYDKPVADTASLGVGYYTFNDKDCPAST